MNIKDISRLTELSRETVRTKAKELFPLKFENGKTTYFSKDESIKIVAELRKKGFIQPAENLQVPTENLQVKEIIKEAFKEMIPLMQTMITETVKTVTGNQKQLQYKQDYFSIIGYANSKGIHNLTTSEAYKFSIDAKHLSQNLGKEIRKVPDERWGTVNSYHTDILKIVFEM